MAIFRICYRSCKQDTLFEYSEFGLIFRLRHVGYADIIQDLGEFFGDVYSAFKIYVSVGVLTAASCPVPFSTLCASQLDSGYQDCGRDTCM